MVYNANGDYMTKPHQIGLKVLKRINDASYEAFFVGGFVRDFILKIESTDIDIATNARPEAIQSLFDKVIPTGLKYGTVTVIEEGYTFEVTTYRTEDNYQDNRHPDTVKYSTYLKDDLSRRDFTINQLVMDKNGQIFDHHHGLDDLNNQRIRTIGDPKARFEEDSLRLLRAFRFSAKLGFQIEEKTIEAIIQVGALIRNVSIERIQNELSMLFEMPHKKKAIQAMIDTDFHRALFDLNAGFNKLYETTALFDELLAWTVLFLESGYDAKLWKLPNKTIHSIKTITKLHLQSKDSPFDVFQLFNFGLSMVTYANQLNQIYGLEDQTALIKSLHQSMPIHHVCDLAFKGEHIIKQFKITNKRHIGALIDYLIEAVLLKQVDNDYESLKKYAQEVLQRLESGL